MVVDEWPRFPGYTRITLVNRKAKRMHAIYVEKYIGLIGDYRGMLDQFNMMLAGWVEN